MEAKPQNNDHFPRGCPALTSVFKASKFNPSSSASLERFPISWFSFAFSSRSFLLYFCSDSVWWFLTSWNSEQCFHNSTGKLVGHFYCSLFLQVNLEFYFPYQLLQKTICLFLMLLYRALQIYHISMEKKENLAMKARYDLVDQFWGKELSLPYSLPIKDTEIKQRFDWGMAIFFLSYLFNTYYPV